MLQTITCGESHNKYLAAILEGMPSGLKDRKSTRLNSSHT